MRADFFGATGDTRWNQKRLQETFLKFKHHELDIRNRIGCQKLLAEIQPDVVVVKIVELNLTRLPGKRKAQCL
ncbi:MAG: hypothetical protein HEQ20_13150 [Aphanizomenon flos-aquae KM1D3_PB]|jgi:CDP-paratose 2-epimerase|uniref:hypothetical protein n=1 Tax=Aphanizomenon flos-aquae TaxID=1176 RepID=UPI00054268EC|nr:hypothetical protein OA07_10125 [Aphanizomenon flos-aquae 2012/KM1/D3]KHG42996.1 hypothetical protein OA07_01640 [Aphanizomenon flos-aquae 2012/KM1/D3]QSV67790.1 MAG: hypothetical protein HEQ12_13275 [Aphanizomenon flos-aquae DEX188]QSV71525.1 MAG: hypothetical protein HEQ20_13150 [Aphanizomenon flos-aquae KM1D3_PB]